MKKMNLKHVYIEENICITNDWSHDIVIFFIFKKVIKFRYWVGLGM